jgi:soluble lytic murein transglycosylase
VTLGLGRTPLDVQPLDDDAAWTRLVDALRDRESGGGKPLVSRKGALGSLQLMPGTADDMLKALGRRDVLALPAPERRHRVRFDRTLNEALGQEYLRRQLRDFGDPVLALAAYNGGPANVKRWLKKNGDPRKGEVDLATWIERIPFGETRAYVKTVTAKAGMAPKPPQAFQPEGPAVEPAAASSAPAPWRAEMPWGIAALAPSPIAGPTPWRVEPLPVTAPLPVTKPLFLAEDDPLARLLGRG